MNITYGGPNDPSNLANSKQAPQVLAGDYNGVNNPTTKSSLDFSVPPKTSVSTPTQTHRGWNGHKDQINKCPLSAMAICTGSNPSLMEQEAGQILCANLM